VRFAGRIPQCRRGGAISMLFAVLPLAQRLHHAEVSRERPRDSSQIHRWNRIRVVVNRYAGDVDGFAVLVEAESMREERC
jgi:hypothetical protein